MIRIRTNPEGCTSSGYVSLEESSLAREGSRSAILIGDEPDVTDGTVT